MPEVKQRTLSYGEVQELKRLAALEAERPPVNIPKKLSQEAKRARKSGWLPMGIKPSRYRFPGNQ